MKRLREELVALAEKHGRQRSSLMAILQDVQRRHARISEYAMQVIADLLDIHPVEVYSVVSFYSFLGEQPQGQFVIRLCRTITCDMAGKSQIARQLENDLGIRFGADDAGREVLAPLGQLPGDVRPRAGDAGQRPDLHRPDAGKGPRHAGAVPAVVCRPLCRRRRNRTHDQSDENRRVDVFDHRARQRPGGALAKEPREVLAADRPLRAAGPRRGRLPHQPEMEHGRRRRRGENKYVVCNADEGEPGTFKDRVILTDFADLVFEGMTIGARVIGARHGIMYLRSEYTYLRPQLEAVLASRRKQNLLGKNIAGREGFDFDIDIHMGSGAYVCGEETAMIESLKGTAASPATAPPSPSTPATSAGPTIVNNVETFAWVVCILARGADWFKSHGTDKSSGYKLFSVSGDCKLPGVYEFPMGITIAKLLEEVQGEGAKAVQVGGASGQCVPAAAVRPHPGLRGRLHRRLGHRLRPAARHARRGRELPRVLHRRIVRPVYPLPRRRAEAPRRRPPAQTRQVLDDLSQGALRPGRDAAVGQQVRAGAIGPQRLALRRRPLPGRNPRPHRVARDASKRRNKES